MSTSERSELLTAGPAEALANLLDVEPAASYLPPAWHWVYLLDRPAQRDLGPDGHARTGVPSPPEPGMRRMFGGGRLRTHARLRYDEPATRIARVADSTTKHGRSGPLTFVTVQIEVHQGGAIAVTEQHDIVYRPGLSGPSAPAAPSAPSAPSAPDRRAFDAAMKAALTIAVDETVLFRFSALTYNAHRIHYDAGYAALEGYPGLVVHGPLQALLMAEAFRSVGTDLTGREFSYRLVAPIFSPQVVTARVSPDGQQAELVDSAGFVSAVATLS